MGEFFMELKPLGVVAAVVSIVWLTAISDIEPRPEGPTLSDRYEEQIVDAWDDLAGWHEGWGLVNVEVEAE
jgi:hypothetical protein